MIEKYKFVLPGDLFYSAEPYKISTILGSCVAVVLFNTKYCFGGLNHYMLNTPPCFSNSNKYGSISIPNLIEPLLAIDPDINNYQAKIFGGGNVISHIKNSSFGKNNIEIARKILKNYNIRIVNEYVGNDFGLKLFFFNKTNKVFVAKIQKQDLDVENIYLEQTRNYLKNFFILSDDIIFKNLFLEWVEYKKNIIVFSSDNFEKVKNMLEKSKNNFIIADFKFFNDSLKNTINAFKNTKVYILCSKSEAGHVYNSFNVICKEDIADAGYNRYFDKIY